MHLGSDHKRRFGSIDFARGFQLPRFSSLKKRKVLSLAQIWTLLPLAALIFLILPDIGCLLRRSTSIDQPIASPVREATFQTTKQTSSKRYRFCDADLKSESKCIFDIGVNTGQDTKNYLDSGARVLGVEANPTLVKESSERFAEAILQNKLLILERGLIGQSQLQSRESDATASEGGGDSGLTFWRNTVNDKFGSFEEYLGCRSRNGTVVPKEDHRFCEKVKVRTTTCAKLVEKYGTPEYMKIDIEGLDRACLESMKSLQENDRPKYISIENVWEYDVKLLQNLGYSRFKVVNQAALQIGMNTEAEGHSGPWGEDAMDINYGKRWRTVEQILGALPMPNKIMMNGKEYKGWYDLHAAR